MFFDPKYFVFMLPALLIGLWAQFKLTSAYARFSRVGLASRLTGFQAAREILDQAGLQNVPVEEIPGQLTDHYDPTKRALRLSSNNFRGASVAAVGVAAHEAGHALQHQVGYAPMKLRAALVPATRFASYAWIVLIMIGFFLQMTNLIYVGIGLFSIMMLFQMVTLPVEFDASRRAKVELLRLGIVRSEESAGVGQVLNAAGLTYVAALVSSVMQLLYFLSIARGRD